MANGFQASVGTQPAPAVAGDFADHNPRVSAMAGPGGFVAGGTTGEEEGGEEPAHQFTSHQRTHVAAVAMAFA